jgi:hypothetical protein
MMLRYLTSTLVACAFTGTVSLLAQQSPESPAPQAPKDDAAKATLTGCVMQAKTTDGSPVFVLDKAEGGSATLYVLLGSSEMATNVNKKVEVTGPVQEPPKPPAADEGAGAKEGAAASQKVLRPPMMQVESVKVVAESCK